MHRYRVFTAVQLLRIGAEQLGMARRSLFRPTAVRVSICSVVVAATCNVIFQVAMRCGVVEPWWNRLQFHWHCSSASGAFYRAISVSE